MPHRKGKKETERAKKTARFAANRIHKSDLEKQLYDLVGDDRRADKLIEAARNIATHHPDFTFRDIMEKVIAREARRYGSPPRSIKK